MATGTQAGPQDKKTVDIALEVVADGTAPTHSGPSLGTELPAAEHPGKFSTQPRVASLLVSVGEPVPKVEAQQTTHIEAASVQAPSFSSKSKPLTPNQIAERLALNSNGLVEEIHALSLRQVQQEEARETRLDAKAGGLLGTAGLSLTVAFTFGGLLLQHPDYLLPLGPGLARAVLIAYVVALVAGLAAVIAAVRALFVNDDYESVSEDNVFNEAVLDQIDRAARSKEDGQRFYRRYITVKHWSIYRAHFAIHQEKASKIRRGQAFFLAFLGSLIFIGVLLTYAAFEQYKDVETEKAAAPTIGL